MLFSHVLVAGCDEPQIFARRANPNGIALTHVYGEPYWRSGGRVPLGIAVVHESLARAFTPPRGYKLKVVRFIYHMPTNAPALANFNIPSSNTGGWSWVLMLSVSHKSI